jgi:uncharacterized membrane protein
LKRDTRVLLVALVPIPALILAASALCSWAVAHGASPRWRLLFRVMCHGIATRCLQMFGVAMPICARCVGVYAGLLGGLLLFPLLPAVRERAMRIAAFVAVTPLAIDGLTQLARLRESTNPLRLATGLVAGFAFGLWILTAVERRDDALFTAS